MRAARPTDDDLRVAALRRYGVLDVPGGPDLEALVRLASHITGAPIAAVNLFDRDRQWCAAGTGGIPVGATPRDVSLCAHTVTEGSLIHTADARRDGRFADSPWVDGRWAEARMFVSAPLRTADGWVFGTICAVDSVPRELAPAQLGAMTDLAEQAVALLELRRHVHRLQETLTELDHHASHDPLTGLPNRRVFMDRLDQARYRAARAVEPTVLLFCDLDRFKEINDVHGHEVGDALLVEVARRVQAQLRPMDTVARLGGDEFALLCEDVPRASRVDLVDRVRTAATAPVQLGDLSVRVGVSIGLVEVLPDYRPDGADSRSLLRTADIRMYADKARRAIAHAAARTRGL